MSSLDRRTRTLLRAATIGGLFAIVSLLVVVPLLMIVMAAFGTAVPFSGGRWDFTLANFGALLSPDIAVAFYNTMVVSIGGTIIAVSIGTTLAWLAARSDVPFKPLVHLAGIMPLFVSLVVASVTWSFLGSGRSGYLNIIFSSLGLPIQLEMRSLAGITFVHGLYYTPYSYIFVFGALSLLNPDLEQAAAVHRASLRQTLMRITFPLVKPALIAATLLSFVSMIEEFPVPAVLGGPVGIDTVSIRIYNLMSRVPGKPNEAAALSIALIAFVCVLVYFQRRALKGKDFRTVTGKGMRAQIVPLHGFKFPAVAFVFLYAFIALGLPIIALILGATRSNLYIRDAADLFDVTKLTTRHLIHALNNPSVQSGLMNSLIAGFGTVFFGSILYFCIAYVVHRTDLRGRQFLEYLSVVPIALPALVMGLGILWTWLAIPLPIYGTMAIMVIAFMSRFMPQGVHAIGASITQIHHELEEAAMVSGASRARAISRITLPLLRGTVVSAAFLILILSMRELTASLLLYTTNTRVLSIVIFESYEQGVWTSVASMSLIYTAILLFLTVVGRRWMQSRIQ